MAPSAMASCRCVPPWKGLREDARFNRRHHLIDVLRERLDHPAGGGEHHHAHPVAVAELRQSLLRGFGHLLHHGAHAAADIKDQQQVERRVFVREIEDLTRGAVVEDAEIGLFEAQNRLGAEQHLGVHTHDVHLGPEQGGLLFRLHFAPLPQRGEAQQREQNQTDAHEPPPLR
jgi:hypothetical protein